MSSAWWLAWTCLLGLPQMGKTSDNLIKTSECVINLPSEDLVTHVNRLAPSDLMKFVYSPANPPDVNSGARWP